jgi:hypothetical protein
MVHTVVLHDSIRLKFGKVFYMAKIFISLLAVASLSGLVASKAGTTLPGDQLYRVKTEVIEPIGAALALGASTKAELATRTASKRLAELEALISNARLSTHTQIQLTDAFDAQIAEAIAQMRELALHGRAAEALAQSTALADTLALHVIVLNALNSPLALHVQTALDKVSALRGTISTK